MSSLTPLPAPLGGTFERLVAADGASVRQAINDGAQGLEEVVILGPTEEAFGELVDIALHTGESELIRGTQLTDTASLTSYTLLLYDAEVEVHDGLRRGRRKTPLLIRFSRAGAFETGWESLLNLRAEPPGDGLPPTLPPAVRADGLREASAALRRDADRELAERNAWVATTLAALARPPRQPH